MAFDEKAAARVRRIFFGREDVIERKMMGGLCFMLGDAMCCGLTGDALMVRVGKQAHAEALAQPHARPMTFTGRPLSGFVFVDPDGYRDDVALAAWINRGIEFVATLPPKKIVVKGRRPTPARGAHPRGR